MKKLALTILLLLGGTCLAQISGGGPVGGTTPPTSTNGLASVIYVNSATNGNVASATHATTADISSNVVASVLAPYVKVNQGVATNLNVNGLSSTNLWVNTNSFTFISGTIGMIGLPISVDIFSIRAQSAYNGVRFYRGNDGAIVNIIDGGHFILNGSTFEASGGQNISVTSPMAISAGGSAISNINTAVGVAVAWPALTLIGQTDTNTLALTGASPTASAIPPPTISPADLGAKYDTECISNNVVSVYRTALIAVGVVTNRVRVTTTGF